MPYRTRGMHNGRACIIDRLSCWDRKNPVADCGVVALYYRAINCIRRAYILHDAVHAQTAQTTILPPVLSSSVQPTTSTCTAVL